MMTGIPISKVAASESQKLLRMSKILTEDIIGQDEAIDILTKSIQRARAGLKNPKRPIGVFLFLGPTGVGKTETAKVLAKYLFSRGDSLIKIDMSEYMERFAVSRLIGAPPGYIGYEEGGELTERVRRNPYSVVLFDEIEKAHYDVFNILLQVLDEGMLTDSTGRKVDFRNTIIIMTSNIGTRGFGKVGIFGFGETSENFNYESVKSNLFEEIKEVFNPEFLNRLDETIVFRPLYKESVLKIIDLELNDLISNLSNKKMEMSLTARAKNLILKNGYSIEYGARPLRREIQTSIEGPISEKILQGIFSEGDKIIVDTKSGEFIFKKAISRRTRELEATDTSSEKRSLRQSTNSKSDNQS